MLCATGYFILICIASCESGVAAVPYNGAQVWRTSLQGSEDILLIKKLMDNKDISIWNLSPLQADYLVLADNKMRVHRQLKVRNLDHTVLIMDVQRRVDALQPKEALWDENSLRNGHRLDFKSYPNMKIINEYLNYLADSFPSLCKLQTIGRTFENRTIQMLNISNGNPTNRVVLITAGLHGREWLAISSALYILNDIVTRFDQQPLHIKNKNWLIIPVVNPDGYDYSHTTDRLWRKNRSGTKNCRGVDINRNFETDWGIVGITVNSHCGEVYSGPFPFSEAESKALRYLLLKIKKTPVALIDIHAYRQLILFPWSARAQPTEHVKIHKDVALAMSQAIYNNSKQRYNFGPTYHRIYPATGALIDFAYSSGVHQSYAFETRDKGAHGFLVPPAYIEETGKEMFAAITELAKSVDFINKGRDVFWF